MAAETYHIPVMLQECIDNLAIKPDGIYIDLTMGGGGHTREILKHLGPKGHLYSLDQDPDAAANAPDDERHTFVASNFRFLRGALRLRGVEPVDGILVGDVSETAEIVYGNEKLALCALQNAYEDKLEGVYPCNIGSPAGKAAKMAFSHALSSYSGKFQPSMARRAS